MKHTIQRFTRWQHLWRKLLACGVCSTGNRKLTVCATSNAGSAAASRRWGAIGVPAAMLFFVLSVQAQPTITSASNPVVIPIGQTSGATTITWKAAPDYTYSEIYLSIDKIGRAHV